MMLEGAPADLTGRNVLGFAYLSLVGTALAFVVWFTGIRRLPIAAPPLLGLAAPVTGATARVDRPRPVDVDGPTCRTRDHDLGDRLGAAIAARTSAGSRHIGQIGGPPGAANSPVTTKPTRSYRTRERVLVASR